jgi:hypothetical protein
VVFVGNWLVFFLTLMTSIAYFCEFLLGPDGADKRAKGTVLELWVHANHENWWPVYQVPATVIAAFLKEKLHLGGGWLKFCASLALYSGIVTILACIVTAASWTENQNIEFREYISRVADLAQSTLIPNYIGDGLSWFLTYRALNAISQSNPLRSLGIAVLGFLTVAMIGSAVMAAATVSSIALMFLPKAFSLGHVLDLLSVLASSFVTLCLELFGNVLAGIFRFGVPGSLTWQNHAQFIQLLLPFSMFVFLTIVLVLLLLFRPVVKPSVILVLERLDAAPKGVITAIAFFLTALATAVSAFIKAWGTQ